MLNDTYEIPIYYPVRTIFRRFSMIILFLKAIFSLMFLVHLSHMSSFFTFIPNLRFIDTCHNEKRIWLCVQCAIFPGLDTVIKSRIYFLVLMTTRMIILSAWQLLEESSLLFFYHGSLRLWYFSV